MMRHHLHMPSYFLGTFTEYPYLKSARIYCSLQNPFTFTHYEGYNPEVSNRSAVTTNGEDYGVYPLARTTSIGVNLTF